MHENRILVNDGVLFITSYFSWYDIGQLRERNQPLLPVRLLHGKAIRIADLVSATIKILVDLELTF